MRLWLRGQCNPSVVYASTIYALCLHFVPTWGDRGEEHRWPPGAEVYACTCSDRAVTGYGERRCHPKRIYTLLFFTSARSCRRRVSAWWSAKTTVSPRHHPGQEGTLPVISAIICWRRATYARYQPQLRKNLSHIFELLKGLIYRIFFYYGRQNSCYDVCSIPL